jgi:glutathione S-transferase
MSASDLTRPSIRRYRRGEHLTAADIAIIRVWLRAWLDANHRHTPGVTRLLAEVDEILTRPASTGGSSGRGTWACTRSPTKLLRSEPGWRNRAGRAAL